MIAILLAAGPGAKFWPYNEVRNKCAFPIGNVPVIRRLALQLLECGVEGVVVVLGAHSASVRAALAGLEDRVRYVHQTGHAGTAEAVLHALEGRSDEPFVAAYGDVITTPETVASLCRAAGEQESAAVAVVQPLDGERPGDWITCRVRDSALTDFQGHGRGGTHRLCGLYALRPPAAPYLRANPGLMTHVPVGGMPAPEAEIAESLARMADDGLPVAALPALGFFVDLDKPWHILEATSRLLEDLSRRTTENQVGEGARIDESAEIQGRVVLGPGAEIGKRVVVHGDLFAGAGASITNGAILGPRCMVAARARVRDYAIVGQDSVLGPETVTQHCAEFDGVLLEGVHLYHYCELYGVLGAQVDIGAATVCGTLRFDDGQTVHRVRGRPEVPRQGANATYLGDYSRTGVNAILMPGVKVGAYSCVGAGVVLYDDLPSREMVLVKQELVRRPWGPERYGW